MKQIKLGKSKLFALVDDDDFDFISQWKWHLSTHGYPISTLAGTGKIYMHIVINNTPRNMVTDHINRDRLDNRRENLRSASKFQNAINSNLQKNNKSGHKGISWNKKLKKWESYITKNQKHIFLGYFIEIGKAILARQAAERKYWA